AIFLSLLCGHAMADYALQTDFIAKGKSRKLNPDGPVPWYYILAAHALIHGLTVVMILLATMPIPLCLRGLVRCDDFILIAAMLGCGEAVAHWWIDLAKCEGLTDIHQDQLLHVACKAAIAILALP